MEKDPFFNKQFIVRKGDFARAGEASVAIKTILKEVGIDSSIIRRVAIAAFEAEMNMVMYGGGGKIRLSLTKDCVHLKVMDKGPGIPDISLAMTEGYSTATHEMREMGFGAGMGLPNINKNANELKIDSKLNEGTTLDIWFWIKTD
ncbi:anti-sigma regulatory factor [bacterium I07]|nr:anti-sigma regulatory factor [bacterium I07]